MARPSSAATWDKLPLAMHIDQFIARWSARGDAERANKDSFLNELCDVLEVERLGNPNAAPRGASSLDDTGRGSEV